MAEGGVTIIIKKVKKGGHAHHGGAWKVAYADFVTAMMAFFLLLWLLGSVSQEQLEGISEYFAPAAPAKTTSGSGDIMGGKVAGEEGAMEVSATRPSVTLNLPPPKAGEGGELDESEDKEASEAEEAEEKLREQEEQEFEEAADSLRQAIQSIPSLKELAKSLLIDNTPEGLRIQIVDQEGLAMFPSGGSSMYLHTKKVLELVAKVIKAMPQKIKVAGHTDSTQFITKTGYSNWELSADRANASRRVLLDLGVHESRFSRIVGMAATDPLLADDTENPRNRRISLILLRGTGNQVLKAEQPAPAQ
jgi:chemotaxis protein MotB